MHCPMTQHPNNVLILGGGGHDIFLKILHQAGFETTRQAWTLAKRHALAIAPHPSKTLFRPTQLRFNAGLKIHVTHRPCFCKECFD